MLKLQGEMLCRHDKLCKRVKRVLAKSSQICLVNTDIKKKLALPISYAQYTKSKTMLVQIFVFKKNLVEEQLICFFLHFFLSTFNQEKTNKIFI